MVNTDVTDFCVSAKVGAARLNMGESTWWRMVQRGLLPKPTYRIGLRCTRWSWAEVLAHLAKQAAPTPPKRRSKAKQAEGGSK